MKLRSGDEVSRELKSLTLATQWRRAGPLHPKLPRNTKAQPKLGVWRGIFGLQREECGQKHENPALGWVTGGKLYRTASQSLTLVSI
jgi:hypothetical protein